MAIIQYASKIKGLVICFLSGVKKDGSCEIIIALFVFPFVCLTLFGGIFS